jgi:hypothetical protein
MTPAGFITQHLDTYGRPVRVFATGIGGDVVEEYAYDEAGRVTGATLPHLASSSVVPTVAYIHDSLDRVTRVTHSDGTFSTQHHATPVSLSPSHAPWLTDLCPPGPSPLCGVDVILRARECRSRSIFWPVVVEWGSTGSS